MRIARTRRKATDVPETQKPWADLGTGSQSGATVSEFLGCRACLVIYGCATAVYGASRLPQFWSQIPGIAMRGACVGGPPTELQRLSRHSGEVSAEMSHNVGQHSISSTQLNLPVTEGE